MKYPHTALLASILMLILMSCVLINAAAVPIEQSRSIEEEISATLIVQDSSSESIVARLDDNERCKKDSDCLSTYCQFSGLNGIGRCRQEGEEQSYDSNVFAKRASLEKRQNVTIPDPVPPPPPKPAPVPINITTPEVVPPSPPIIICQSNVTTPGAPSTCPNTTAPAPVIPPPVTQPNVTTSPIITNTTSPIITNTTSPIITNTTSPIITNSTTPANNTTCSNSTSTTTTTTVFSTATVNNTVTETKTATTTQFNVSTITKYETTTSTATTTLNSTYTTTKNITVTSTLAPNTTTITSTSTVTAAPSTVTVTTAKPCDTARAKPRFHLRFPANCCPISSVQRCSSDNLTNALITVDLSCPSRRTVAEYQEILNRYKTAGALANVFITCGSDRRTTYVY